MEGPRVSYGEVKKIVPRVKNLERVCKSIIYGNAGSAPHTHTHTHAQVTRRERGPGVEQEKAEGRSGGVKVGSEAGDLHSYLTL